MLLAQKIEFNELLITPNGQVKESQLLSFPSLEVKNISLNESRSPSRKQKDSRHEEFKLENIGREYRSNILGHISGVSQETSHTKWVSEKKIESPEINRKPRSFMTTLKKNTGSYLETRKVEKDEKKAFESISPVPSALGRIKSQRILEAP